LHHNKVLRAALQQALCWQIFVRNPAHAVVPPKAVFTGLAAFDQAETVRLLSAVRHSKLHGPIFIAVTTSLRRG